jgi:hypothetical protein
MYLVLVAVIATGAGGQHEEETSADSILYIADFANARLLVTQPAQ